MVQRLWNAFLWAAFLLPAPAHAGEAVKWGYNMGDESSDGWGLLSPDYALCEIGTEQSPVNLSGAKRSTLPPLRFHYRPSAGRVQYKERALWIDVENGGGLTASGRDYALTHITLHIPSEHLIDSRLYLMEIHLFHRDAEGKQLILAVLGDIGARNETLAAILEKARGPKDASVAAITLDPSGLLPEKRGYFAYRGSLSKPPCTEGIEWRVFKHPIAFDQTQLQKLGATLRRNSRVVQPVYMRTIRSSED